jgi:predicted transcriptional regulator of viral defense system
MNTLLEVELTKFKTHIIEYFSLKNILLKLGYTSINDKINTLNKKGILIPLKKGLYIHNSPINKTIVSKEIISNVLLGPSYISLDYALYYHGLIPESVHELTSITTKRNKSFNTNYGHFSYRHTKKELFPIGLVSIETKIGNFIIASKEKALCDKIYFTNNFTISSKNMMLEFIEEDLRIDIDDLENFDIKIVSEYYNISKSKKIKLLINLMK